jgi:plasmid stabilization system protein ParE
VTRYRLSTEARGDLVEIRQYLTGEVGAAIARHVLSAVRQKLQFLADHPQAGHSRTDLTDEPVKFWSVFSYLIVYDPQTRPIGVARILHAGRDLETLFKDRPPQA